MFILSLFVVGFRYMTDETTNSPSSLFAFWAFKRFRRIARESDPSRQVLPIGERVRTSTSDARLKKLNDIIIYLSRILIGIRTFERYTNHVQ